MRLNSLWLFFIKFSKIIKLCCCSYNSKKIDECVIMHIVHIIFLALGMHFYFDYSQFWCLTVFLLLQDHLNPHRARGMEVWHFRIILNGKCAFLQDLCPTHDHGCCRGPFKNSSNQSAAKLEIFWETHSLRWRGSGWQELRKN